MATQSFFRWYPAPLWVEEEGFELLPNAVQELTGLCGPGEGVYLLPAKPGDQFRFLTENRGDRGGVGLLKDGELVVLEAGTVVTESPTAPWQVTVNFPPDLEAGCYRLILYRWEITWGDWTETSRACEVNAQGGNTGFALVNQSRTGVVGVPLALVVSNGIAVGANPETKVIRYLDRRRAFGFDYPLSPGFYQQVRLHLYLSQPTYPVIEKVYRQSDGVFRTANVTVDRKVQINTGYLDDLTHAALTVATKHDSFFINGVGYSVQGELDHEFFETFEDEDGWFPLSVAQFEGLEQGYNQTNFGCGPEGGSTLDYPCSPLRYEVDSEGADVTGWVISLVAETEARVEYSFYPLSRTVAFTVTGASPVGMTLRSDCGKLILEGAPLTDGSHEVAVLARTEEGYCLAFTLEIVTSPAPESGVFDYTFDLTFN